MKEVVGPSKPSQSVAPSDGIIRFGSFEVDLQAGELRRSGLKVKLSGQPFDVLVALLEKQGQVVTREELHEKLWKQDTFVDFEHGLNKTINKVREALGDDADNPRFVETLPRRGYRFLAPLAQPALVAPPSAATAGDQTNEPAPARVVTVRSKRWIWLSTLVTGRAKLKRQAGFLAALGAVGFAAWWLFSPIPPPRWAGTTEITHDGLPKCCIVTDGSRLYFDQFLSGSRGSPVLTQVSAAGGESSVIPTQIRDPLILDISPDHSQLLIRSAEDMDTAFWILPLPAGSPRPLGNLVGRYARWSPDGRQLVFIKGSDLYLAKSDGSEPQLLKSVKGFPASNSHPTSYPYFSPDGGRVRFTVTWPGSLWEINTNGSNLHRLLAGWHNTADNCCGRWMPDGRYFVFWSDAAGIGNIFALHESGGLFRRASAVPAQLTTGPMEFSSDSVLPSTDGRKLFVQVEQNRSEFVRYDAGSKQFVPFLPGVSATWAAFSRDGKWITYSTVPDGTLWRSRVDGSERLQLTFAATDVGAVSPNWSPDGTQIAYSWPGKHGKIFLIPAGGGSPEELVAEDVEEVDPTWSADGTRLAFARDSQGGKPDIQIVDVKTRQASTLQGSKGLYSPRWSPDGRYLAAETIDGKKLVLYDFKTQEWSDWVTDPDGLGYPSWSGDSRYVYYDHLNADHPSCRRVMVSVHRPEDIFSLQGLRRYGDWWGAWAGQAPDNSRLFTRDPSISDIYALDVDFP